MEEFASHRFTPAPTAQRPLLGLTVLVVEDSRYASEALRLMCLHSGARIRRADSLTAARRHLAIYSPTAALIDMGLPDGSGAELIAEMAAMTPRIPTILGTSADAFAESVAIAAGADGFLLKPHESLAAFQETILAHLPQDRQPGTPRPVNQVDIHADQISMRDDLAHAAEMLRRGANSELKSYAAQFLGGIAQQSHDDALALAARRLGADVADDEHIRNLCSLLDERIEHTPAI